MQIKNGRLVGAKFVAATEAQLDLGQARKNGIPPVSDRQFFQALAMVGAISAWE